MQHVVGDTTSGPKILLIYFPTVICGVLDSGARWHGAVDKHRAWITGMLGDGVRHRVVHARRARRPLMVMIILAVSGIGSGALSALPASMKADVIDLDAIESGEDRAGLFFAAWSLAVKFVAAVGQGLAFTTLAWIGFHAERRKRSQRDLRAARLLLGGPMLLYLTALIIVWNYPITAARHAQLRAELAARGVRPAPPE